MKDIATSEIVTKFRIKGKVISTTPFGSGHINDTYRVVTDAGNTYLLQRVNHFVFRDVPGLMNNLVQVTNHLKEKVRNIAGADPEKQVLTLFETKEGDYFTRDKDGNYWRVFLFLANTKSYDMVTTAQQAFEGGKAFGRFQALLADLDPKLLIDTIPNFHNIEFRLKNLDMAIEANTAKRLSEVLPEIEFVDERRQRMSRILKLGREKIIPLRILHNDTKFNNVLLDENDKAQCVIDLDTVMPGYAAYDFGDAIRTIINTAPEDEPDIELIQLNIPLFEAYTKGYLQEAKGFLTRHELDSLVFGVLLFPYMQGVRFLTDYLDGDTYYKIHTPAHNLQRTRAQLQLLKKMEAAWETLETIILKTWENEIQ